MRDGLLSGLGSERHSRGNVPANALRGNRITAETIGPLQRRPGRVCAAPGCTTTLSIYNLEETCSIHPPARPTAVRVSSIRAERQPHGSWCMAELGCECDDCLPKRLETMSRNRERRAS